VTETVPATKRLEVVSYEAAGLGDRSYLVHDGEKGFVVDPQRDPHPYLETAEGLGVEVTLVLETHVHNDYVSGGLALARRAGARYGVPAGVPFDFKTEGSPLTEGDTVDVGAIKVKVLSTPGHTPHHLAFLAEDTSGTSAVLTGGSLLPGATGRTDLMGPERAASLGKAQWRSVRRLLRELDPTTEVLPTHGFGSFCTAGTAGTGAAAISDRLTVGSERARNPAARLDQGPFVEDITTSPLPVPAYYRYMAPLNRGGAAEPRFGPVPVIGPEVLPGLISGTTAVIDIRPRRQFADAHLRGSLNIELAPQLPTYFGWLVPFSSPFVVVAGSFEELAECRWLLSRIGREEPMGWMPSGFLESVPAGVMGHYEVSSFGGLADRCRSGRPLCIVDVRFHHEWQAGHIKGARHIPLPELGPIMPTLSGEKELWAHCAAGYRAAVATSVLSAGGRLPVLVDDNLDNARTAGLEIV
jgi:hydroxyacylglutathione hydrolase